MPVEGPVICVDLSRYQPGFDFAAFKAGGGLGVILKASEGTSIKDDQYDSHRAAALAAGLKVASYHFFRPSDPEAQADFYLGCAKPALGERVVCDVEDSAVKKGSVHTFFQRILHSRPDLQLTVYTGHVGEEAEAKFGRSEWLAGHTSLWTCQYASSPSPWASKTWPVWSLWQYTDRGTVPGYGQPVDCNQFNGPDAGFLAWMGTDTSEPEPEAEPAVVTVSADRPVRLKLGANVTPA